MADLKNLAAKNWHDGNVVYDWTALEDGVGSMAAGYKWADSNCVLCIRFTIPAMAKSITLSFCNGTGGYTDDRTLRYKITGSEDASLINATSEVPGDGAFIVIGGAWVRNIVTIQKNLSAGTHYLYIWTDNSAVTTNAMLMQWVNAGSYNFIGTYEELMGYLPIKDAVGVRPYHVYVKTAEGPVLLTLYTKTADGPEILS